MGQKGVKRTNPLTIDQLKKVKEAASRLSYRHRLIAQIVPHSGLTTAEFLHLNRNWLTYRTDDKSDGISESSSPDSIVLTVPEESPCVGTLKIEGSNPTAFTAREEPCHHCRPAGVWQAKNDRRANRRILIRAESAVDTMYWWFGQYDTLPISQSSSSRLVREIGDEAGLSRDITLTALRRTFGVLLIARGADRKMVFEWLGVENKHNRLEPLYSTLGRSIPETGEVERSELLNELRRLANDLGHPPSTDEIAQGKHHHETYRRRFGGVIEALEAAGIENSRTSSGEIIKEKLLDELRRLADDLGHAPLVREIRDQAEYDYDTYRRRFGGIEEAREAAGLDDISLKQIPKEDLLNELRRLADDLGHPPSTEDIRERGKHSNSTYTRRFGRLEEAREAAGLDDISLKQIPKEDLLDELRRLADDLGHPPSTTEITEMGKYHYHTYRRRFGGLEAAREAAGLDED